MNHKATLVIATLTIGMITATVRADGISQQIGAFASYQDTEDIEESYGGGLKYVVMLEDIGPKLDCGLDARASWVVFDSDYPDQGMDFDIAAIELTALARYALHGDTKVYAGIGFGYYFFDDGEDVTEHVSLDADTGLYGLIGIEQRVAGNVSLFVEAKYLWLEAAVDGHSDGNDELDLSGLGGTIGISIAL
jgi:outer membrane protein W